MGQQSVQFVRIRLQFLETHIWSERVELKRQPKQLPKRQIQQLEQYMLLIVQHQTGTYSNKANIMHMGLATDSINLVIMNISRGAREIEPYIIHIRAGANKLKSHVP